MRRYLMADAICACGRTHLVAVEFPIGKCGECGSEPEVQDWSTLQTVEVDSCSG